MEKQEPRPRPEGYDKGLAEFGKRIKGWRDFDGDDFCPDCWETFLKKFPPEQQEIVKKDSFPLADHAVRCEANDGWITACDKYKKTVSIPF